MLGFNTGYVEELYRQFLDDPDSVSDSWREFFADYRPSESFVAAAEARRSVSVATEEDSANFTFSTKSLRKSMASLFFPVAD